jgi:DNA-binding response OmpR family regulator
VPSIARLLLVDPDAGRATTLCKQLSANGFHLTHHIDLQRANARLGDDATDLLIALSSLPADPFVRDLRAAGSSMPVLVISESDHYGSRVASLQAGADDVLSIPYALEELIARLYALLRRSAMGRHDNAGSFLCYGDLVVSTDDRQVSRAGQTIKLTVKEYDLLLCLLRHQQEVLSRQRILHAVWGDTWVGDDNLLDVYIRYLRKKIERPDLEPLIHTVRGVGFVLR